MPSPLKIAGIAALAGLMMTVAIVAARAPSSSPERIAIVPVGSDRDPLAVEVARCRALTMPDAGCEAAWDAHQRRFLGRDGDPQ